MTNFRFGGLKLKLLMVSQPPTASFTFLKLAINDKSKELTMKSLNKKDKKMKVEKTRGTNTKKEANERKIEL